MIEKIVKYIPLLIVVYALFSAYSLWEEQEEIFLREESRIEGIQDRINKKEAELKKLEKYYANIEESKENIRVVQDQIQKLQRQLPDIKDDIENLKLIKDLAERLNMQNIDLKTTPEMAIDFYFKTRYTLSVSGTFLQFLLFLEQIAKSQKLLNIPEITLQLPDIVQRSRFTILQGSMGIESFRYNKNFQEKSQIEDIEGKFNIGTK